MFGSMRLLEGKHPPLGIAFVAAAAEAAGHDVTIVDAEALELDPGDAAKLVLESEPDVVGINAATPTVQFARAYARAVKEACDAPIVVGGPQVTAFPEKTLACAEFDIGVVGEGEITFVELVDRLERGQPLDNVAGLVTRHDGGAPKTTECRPHVEDLDSLAPPAWHLLPMSAYGYPMSRKRRYSTFITSRGCPFQCVFCDPEGRLGRRFRFHSPRYVVDQLRVLKESYGVQEVAFYDDTFSAKPSLTDELCDLMLEERLDLVWECRTRVNTVSPELLAKMRRAGCYRIRYGIESGNDEVLKQIKKGITKADVVNALRWTREAGIESIGYFMIGLPGDTLETIEETIRFAGQVRPNYALFSVTCFGSANTELFKWGVEQGIIDGDYWDRYLDSETPQTLVYCARGELDEETLLGLQKRAYRRFYLRPATLSQVARNLVSSPAQSFRTATTMARALGSRARPVR
jgi:radical SAM superfamily enzyme YgiQ (UPF0313 family)